MLLSSFFTGHHGTELGWWMRAPCIRWNYQSHWQAMCTTSVKASIGQFHSINTLQTNEPESFKLPGHTKNNWQGRVEVVEVMEDAFLDISSDFKTCVCFWCDFEAILRRKYKSTTPKFWTFFIWDKNRKRKKETEMDFQNFENHKHKRVKYGPGLFSGGQPPEPTQNCLGDNQSSWGQSSLLWNILFTCNWLLVG